MSDTTGNAAALYDVLASLSIDYREVTHPPLRTVAESKALLGEMPGAQVKNLFLKDKQGQLWLVTCLEDRAFKVRALEKALGMRGCSFAKPELLSETLGVLPGAVTPFALINDGEGTVRFVLDSAILEADTICAHPLHNEATIAIATADFQRFLEFVGHKPTLFDFDTIAEPESETGADEAPD